MSALWAGMNWTKSTFVPFGAKASERRNARPRPSTSTEATLSQGTMKWGTPAST